MKLEFGQYEGQFTAGYVKIKQFLFNKNFDLHRINSLDVFDIVI